MIQQALAIIANSYTPYRGHLHRRIARELTDWRLLSIFTHEVSNSPWAFDASADIGPILLGKGETSDAQSKLSAMAREWHRGGEIVRILVEHDVRTVVVMGYADLGRLRVMRWCHRHGVRILLFGDSNIRGDRLHGAKQLAKKVFLHGVLRSVDAALVCGSLGRRYFEKYGMRSDRIFYFPYEPDYSLIHSLDDAAITSATARFGLARHRRRLMYSGRLIEIKRVDLVIDAFVRLSTHRPDWDLLIVGDGRLRSSLEARVPTNLRTRVTWTGFLDDQIAMSALYRSCDVLIVPSDVEPWGLVVNEGVGAGLAIVATDVVGAAAELVRDGVNGRIVQVGSLDDLAVAIEGVMSNVDAMKEKSAEMLEEWRRRGDPIEGLRRALNP